MATATNAQDRQFGVTESRRHIAEAQVSQGIGIPEPVKPWLSILMARHFNRDLNRCIRGMPEEEALEMVGAILVNEGTLTSFLDAFGLTQPEDGGFWMATVLPLLRKRLAPKHGAVMIDDGDVFEKAKASIRMEDLAERYTQLRPAGAGKLQGLCPLHNERSPSFIVYTDQDSFYCFGACKRGGDVIEFTRLLMAEGLWIT